tara:strand:+ start:174 stop:659 length:486 start_codon:yes stop_codon:yes gene_type:complete
MDALSETESEPEQFPTEPVVEDTSLEKPKRVYKKKVKVVEPTEPATEPAAKPKRVLSEEQKEKMRLAREASKARKALTKPEPITQETEVLPELKKRGRPKKAKEDKVVEPKAEPKEKVIVKEVHHHYNEPKKEKVKKESAPRKPRQPKVESKPTTVVVDFV